MIWGDTYRKGEATNEGGERKQWESHREAGISIIFDWITKVRLVNEVEEIEEVALKD